MNLRDAVLTLALVFCVVNASAQNSYTPAQAQKKSAQIAGSGETAEVVFDKSSTNLNADAHKLLTDRLEQARKHGKVKEIKILAWADQDYPKNGKLDKNQTKIADDRALELKGFFRDRAPGIAIETYNMAETTTPLDRVFKDDSELKKRLADAGLTDPKKAPTKASHALVFFIFE